MTHHCCRFDHRSQITPNQSLRAIIESVAKFLGPSNQYFRLPPENFPDLKMLYPLFLITSVTGCFKC